MSKENSGAPRGAPPKAKSDQDSDLEFEVGPDTNAQGSRDDDSEREATRRVQMIGRARERLAYWQHELAEERFEEFRPEMRRRVQVEQTLIDGLEKTKTPTFILLRTYQRDAVHRPSQPKTADDEEREALGERIAKAVKRRKALADELSLLPQRVSSQRVELQRKIEQEEEYVRDLKAKLRALG